jgi:hypothetical protein
MHLCNDPLEFSSTTNRGARADDWLKQGVLPRGIRTCWYRRLRKTDLFLFRRHLAQQY